MQAFFARADVRQMSHGLEEFAQAVAVVVDDEAVRNRLHERCMERFDGETNVLWNQLNADSRVRGAGGTTASWSERVERVVAANRSGNGAVRAAGGVQAAVAKFEGITSAPLHLFWMYPSNWDRKTTPLVAFVPFDVDPDTRKSIPAFDSKGNRYELDREGKLAKERPVVVITFNERTNLRGEIRKGLLSQTTLSTGAKVLSPKERESSVASAQNIRLNWVQINFAGDELPWDGAAEFFYQCGRGNGPSSDVSTVILGFIPQNQVQALNHSYSLFINVGGFNQGVNWVQFDYYEDDFIFDGLDVFDDHMGSHPFNFPFIIGTTPPLVNKFTTAQYTIN
jgi:hypothetical protein